MREVIFKMINKYNFKNGMSTSRGWWLYQSFIIKNSVYTEKYSGGFYKRKRR